MEGDEQIQPDWIRILGNGREQQKLVVPLPPPPAPSDMQEVGCPCAQIFAVVSLADPMIGILTDYVLQFCCVITKGFPNKVRIRSKMGPSHLGIYLNRKTAYPAFHKVE